MASCTSANEAARALNCLGGGGGGGIWIVTMSVTELIHWKCLMNISKRERVMRTVMALVRLIPNVKLFMLVGENGDDDDGPCLDDFDEEIVEGGIGE